MWRDTRRSQKGIAHVHGPPCTRRDKQRAENATLTHTHTRSLLFLFLIQRLFLHCVKSITRPHLFSSTSLSFFSFFPLITITSVRHPFTPPRREKKSNSCNRKDAHPSQSDSPRKKNFKVRSTGAECWRHSVVVFSFVSLFVC